MIPVLEQDVTELYFFLYQGSNGSDKNEFVSQFMSLHPHFYVKHKI